MRFPVKRKAVYRRYLRSDHWVALRARVLQRDRRRCVDCGGQRFLQVHHLTYKRLGNERLDDLVTLCRDCHHARHDAQLDESPKAMLDRLTEWDERQHLASEPSGRSQSAYAFKAEARRARLDKERQERERVRDERWVTDEERRLLGTGRRVA